MSDNILDFQQQLIDDYQGALIRLATLRANKQQYLLFAWVELYPFDMNVPDGWNSGEEWPVPGSGGWTCAFSAAKVTVAKALEWYEGAGSGSVIVPRTTGRIISIQATGLGPEPAYGGFCAGFDAPFALRWHDGPRVHRYVALSANAEPVRRLGLNHAVREWLKGHLGFDPYELDEWLGGLALLAPDPLCSAVSVFATARADDGRETLMVHVVPRRSAEHGIADVSDLSIHVAERRVDGWSSVRTVSLSSGTSAKLANPQWCYEIGYALVCPKRGLLRFFEPGLWMEQVGIGIHVSNATLMVEVPAGGRRKPAMTVPVMRFHKGIQVSVGSALDDAVRKRLIAARERRKMREKRSKAPQRLFGRLGSETSEDEIQKRRQEAEDFVAGLVSRAQRRVLFVDHYFGVRETRLFALRVSNSHVTVRILTGQRGLLAPGESRHERSLLAADLAHLANMAKQKPVVVPIVRVMSGGKTPDIHDRYLVVDDEVWHCGPSFNELGDRLGVMVRLPDPITIRRAINEVWSRSTLLKNVSSRPRKSMSERLSAILAKVRAWGARS